MPDDTVHRDLRRFPRHLGRRSSGNPGCDRRSTQAVAQGICRLAKLARRVAAEQSFARYVEEDRRGAECRYACDSSRGRTDVQSTIAATRRLSDSKIRREEAARGKQVQAFKRKFR